MNDPEVCAEFDSTLHVREHAEQLITLADAYEGLPDVATPLDLTPEEMDAFFGYLRAARSEAPWMARQLLDALNRIEAARNCHGESEHLGVSTFCLHCGHLWPCPTWLALDPKEADGG